jgi:hypothetical protein
LPAFSNLHAPFPFAQKSKRIFLTAAAASAFSSHGNCIKSNHRNKKVVKVASPNDEIPTEQNTVSFAFAHQPESPGPAGDDTSSLCRTCARLPDPQ